jgi:hypothetical protein
MTKHLAEDALWAAVEGTPTAEALHHLEGCGACRAAVEEARDGLALAESASEVPEPSPLYWQTFRRQVGRRVAEESAPRDWSRFFGLRLLLPAAAAATLLLALSIFRGDDVKAPEKPLPVWVALPPASDDEGLDVLRGVILVGNDLESPAPCRDVVECLGSLNEAESEELADLLRVELPEGLS